MHLLSKLGVSANLFEKKRRVAMYTTVSPRAIRFSRKRRPGETS